MSEPDACLPNAMDFDAVIGLGSNVGDKRANIARAIALLTAAGDVNVIRRSRDYRSAPWGMLNQDWFVNACVAVETGLSAEALLQRCLGTEAVMGRVRHEHWGPRNIDCDVLLYRDAESNDPHLTLPHPRITERAFVLVPLAEIAPDAQIAGQSVRAWLADAESSDVTPL